MVFTDSDRHRETSNQVVDVKEKACTTASTFDAAAYNLSTPDEMICYDLAIGILPHIYAKRLYSHQHDDLNRLSFPKAMFKAKVNRNKCMMCHINSAVCVTLDDRLVGKTPAYFASDYDLFHYDSSGNILYDDVKVFEYSPKCSSD
ncbi:small nuclear RNA activating complex, polypeptide 3 [Dissophora globulifera]|nr:small nuclear RNA activating complex, polypeptide 3 [Dissophora globulifera]